MFAPGVQTGCSAPHEQRAHVQRLQLGRQIVSPLEAESARAEAEIDEDIVENRRTDDAIIFGELERVGGGGIGGEGGLSGRDRWAQSLEALSQVGCGLSCAFGRGATGEGDDAGGGQKPGAKPSA